MTFRASGSLLGILFCCRMFLTAVTVSFTSSKRASRASSHAAARGMSLTMMLCPSRRGARCCHSSSVMKGMKGCSMRSNLSKNALVWAKVFPSAGIPYAGFTISRYHPENSSQNSL